MAEFTDLGSHCALKDCNSIDFLPLLCAFCRNTFCTKHCSLFAHNCPNSETSSASAFESCSISTFRCSKSACNRKELIPIYCKSCDLNFCLKHRFQSDHGCPPFAKSSDDDRKIIVSKKTNENHDVDTRKFADQRQKFEQKNKKRDSITSKVALMKLKQTALGDKNFPEEERLYFYVDLPKNAKFSVLAVCFSKEWSIGKCIDVIVKLGEIPLENPQNNQKLKLFAKIEQEYRFLSPDDCLIKLIDSDLISNAITLYAFYF